jgi:uncharacterized membrane protein
LDSSGFCHRVALDFSANAIAWGARLMSNPLTPGTPSDSKCRAEKVQSVELLISKLLRFGVIVSFCFVTFGTILTFMHHQDYASSSDRLAELTKPGAAFPHSISEVMADAARLRGQAIVMIGLIFLIATPVLRVAISILSFLHERDSTYVTITTVVLLLLLASFALGRIEGS